MSEVHEEVLVEALLPGDMIDLENDPFADPFGAVGYTEDEPDQDCANRDVLRGWHDYEEDHDILGFEYAVVEDTEVHYEGDKSNPDNKSGVMVYTQLMNVHFPIGHKVKRYAPDDPEERGDDDQFGFAELVVDGQRWADSEGETRFSVADVYDLATRVRDQGYTDVKVEYIDD